jgi:hypothetical protein
MRADEVRSDFVEVQRRKCFKVLVLGRCATRGAHKVCERSSTAKSGRRGTEEHRDERCVSRSLGLRPGPQVS